MAGEKIARGYLLHHARDRALGDLLSTHEALENFIKRYRKSPEARKRYVGRDAQFDEVMQQVGGLAADIEKLAPAVDRQKFPTNAEYPWSNGAALTVPCEYAYPVTGSFAPNVWKALEQVLHDVSQDLAKMNAPASWGPLLKYSSFPADLTPPARAGGVSVCGSQPVYDSSCSISLSTQSNSPEVTFALQWVQLPLMLMARGAPQLGQLVSAGALVRAPALRMSVQYSV